MGEVTDPALLALLNGEAAPAPTGPVFGPPPKPKDPPAPKTTYRTLTPEEVAARGLPTGKAFQVSSEGKVDAVGGDSEGTEAERKAASFLIRALGSNDKYEAQRIGPRSLVGQAIADNVPNVLNSLPSAIGNSPQRQVADSSQDEFIAASLRQDSGAAIPPEEMERQRRIYFPMPGDEPEVIEAKRMARLRAVEGLKQSAGRMAEGAIQRWQGMDPNKPESITVTDDGQPGLTGTVTDDSGVATPGDGPPSPDAPIDPEVKKLADLEGDQSGWRGIKNAAVQGITLGHSDEVAGVGGFLSAYLTGKDPMQEYDRNKAAQNLIIERAREAHPYLAPAAELAGGGGAARFAGGALSLAQAVRQGAGIGALSGFGYGNGAQDSVQNALIGGVAGGALGAGLQVAGNALASRAARVRPDMEVVAAGQRQNIPIRQADARPELRGKYAAAESTSAGPMIKQARADDAAVIEARAAEIGAGKPFSHADSTALGQTAQRIAERGSQNVKEAASTLYKRVERAAPDFQAPGKQTMDFIDQKIAALEALSPTGYSAEVAALKNMKSDLEKTGLSVDTLQAQRMTVGGRIGDNIADRTRADATLTEVLKVAESELHSALGAVNPGAASTLKRADAKWGQYKDLQREVTSKFLGRRGEATAETAARELGAMVNGKGNYNALRRYMALATPEERADFATTFALEWGRTARGRGDFSPAELAKNLGNVSDRTLNAMFGRKGSSALRDLQLISNAKTDAMARQAPSGMAISKMAGGLKRLIWGGLGLVGGGPLGAVAGGAAQPIVAKLGEERAARLLLNPDFTKWVRNMPDTANPRAIDRYFDKLAGMSSVAANDNQAFVAAIREGFGARVQEAGRLSGPAAAQEEQDGGQK